MNKTTIEWTDYTWNPVTGCHKVSQGCKNCYAETLFNRFGPKKQEDGSLKIVNKAFDHFFRDVKIRYERLNEPVVMRKKLEGKKVFVCDMSDLFHEAVPFWFIDKVFDVMLQLPKTTFQILTKRPHIAAHYFSMRFPSLGMFKNIWIGISCEDQKTSDERIPELLKIKAAVRFLSLEPMLGPIDIVRTIVKHSFKVIPGHEIQWVIVGGESGHGARPLHPDWVRKVRDDCQENKISFFFKQWGEYEPFESHWQAPFYQSACTGEMFDGHHMNFIDGATCEGGKFQGCSWYDPLDSISLCLETHSENCSFLRKGKSKTGNLLDGKKYQEFPKM